MRNIYQPEFECMPQELLSRLQLEKLKKMVSYCYQKIPFYRERLGSVGITSGDDIGSLEDIQRIPFTTKDDLKALYPWGFLAIPPKHIARIHASSGTTGKPTVAYYSKRDMEIWSTLAARVLVCNGITEDDIFQLSVGYGLFTGAFGFHQGAERIGCTVIPASTGNTDKQMVVLHDLGVTAITATPSYAAYLSERISSSGRRDEYALKKFLLGAERCSDKMRKTIETNLNVETADNYGLTEFMGPGVAGECEYRNGMHINEDYFYPEIIDPETETVLGDDQDGELVFTSLEREAMPLLRYRTRDLTSIHHGQCACGRTLVKMKAPFGRTDDMFVFKGINVFPTQIEFAMSEIHGISPHYQITLTRDSHFQDKALITVELMDSGLPEDAKQAIKSKIERRIREVVLVRMEIELAEPGTLERYSGKAKRVHDLRTEME